MGSGGGGGGGNPAALYQNAAPMGGLPIAGAESTIGSPYEYGQFQSFLPDVPTAEQHSQGQRAPSATGLNSDMFQYRSPTGVVAESGVGNQISDLRGALAKLTAEAAAKKDDNPFAHPLIRDYGTTSSGYGG